jgi:hypothetical protein
MIFILTHHAKERLKKRWIPDPNDVNPREMKTNHLKQLNRAQFSRKCKIYVFANYMYVCKKDNDRVVLITAYKFKNINIK